MKGFTPLLKKEIKQQLRTHRLLVLGGVFLLFALMAPLLLYFLPEILQMAGEGVNIEIPPPTAVKSFSDYAGYIAQFGILIAVLVAMSAITHELAQGTALVTLSKPVNYGAFVSAKFIAMSLTLVVSMAAAATACYGYTVWLIGGTVVLPFIWLNLLMALFLMFCLALTLLFSSLFKSALAAGGTALAVILALSAVPVVKEYLPGKILGWGIGLLNGSGENYWWALGATVAGIFLCLYLSQTILQRKEI